MGFIVSIILIAVGFILALAVQIRQTRTQST